jgi:glycosyltransferase involved in cell wall biosynthesis
MDNKRASIIVRTIARRLEFLDHALFSVLGNNYPDIEVVVVVQTKDDGAYQSVVELGEIYIQLGMKLQIVRNETDEDRRAQNLNLGLAAATGRYVGFLDDDDVLYPEHISFLVKALEESSNAWIYADVVAVFGDCDTLEQFYVKSHDRSRFKKETFSYSDFWRGNHIPIHSYLVDRERVNPVCLQFDQSFSVLEDYAFLLKLSVVHEPQYLPRTTSEYRFRLDGTNTTCLVEQTLGVEANEKQKVWDDAEKQVAIFRKNLLLNPIPVKIEALNEETTVTALVRRFQQEYHQVNDIYIHAVTQCQKAKDELQRSRKQVESLRSQLEEMKAKLGNAEGRIAAMETSKFWKMRAGWFKMKKVLRLKADEQ